MSAIRKAKVSNRFDKVYGKNRIYVSGISSPVDTTYAFDSIGNRTEAKTGGDTNGFNLRTTSYSANGLNEYTSITTPGYKDILGSSHATNTVTVNGASADRKVEYFHAELTLTNGSNPLWTAVSVVGGGATNSGGFVHPKNVQTLTYDDDGNLTFDGVWTYQWDAENRLVQMVMTNVSSVPDIQRKKLSFAYDHQNRRIQKKVYTGTNGVFSSTASSDLRFAYDGINLQAELDNTNGVIRAYAWGIDLGGTLNRAGGVGGLLVLSINSTNIFPSFDEIGNVIALTQGDGTPVASYEYGAFGEQIRTQGLFAKGNPFRFSSKYTDEETSFVYYGRRFYAPSLGRWLGRDPIDERDFSNLFLFISNDGINGIDPTGEKRFDKWLAELAISLIMRLAPDPDGADVKFKIPRNPRSSRGQQIVLEGAKIADKKTKKRLKGGFGGRVGGTTAVLALGLVSLEATMRTAVAGANLLNGAGAYDETDQMLQSYLSKKVMGDQGEADFDAILAGIEIGGGEAAASLAAWGTVEMIGDAFMDRCE